jgi:predicted GIY-YIG superfamily endonuclease
MWYVYIVRCADRTFYTGVARDLTARLAAHNAGRGAKYTRTRLPVKLVYQETAVDRSAALRREHAIKRLARADKAALSRQARRPRGGR